MFSFFFGTRTRKLCTFVGLTLLDLAAFWLNIFRGTLVNTVIGSFNFVGAVLCFLIVCILVFERRK